MKDVFMGNKSNNYWPFRFVIQITIYTFVPTAKLAILASRVQKSSDPEEDLKAKS
jgi:hypothetical protein